MHNNRKIKEETYQNINWSAATTKSTQQSN